jgi:hypothetical protein
VTLVGLVWAGRRPAPARPNSARVAVSCALLVCAAACAGAIALADHAPVPVVWALAAVLGAGAVWCRWLSRAPGVDSDDGGTDGGLGDRPSPAPIGPDGGATFDWDAFEREFWSHVERSRPRRRERERR